MVEKAKQGFMEHVKTGIQILIFIGGIIWGASEIISEIRTGMIETKKGISEINNRLDVVQVKIDQFDKLETRCKNYGKAIGVISDSCCPSDTSKKVNRLFLED